MDNNYNSDLQTTYEAEIRCPGKEITAFVFSINSLVWGGLSLLFCWHIVVAVVYMLIGIGCSITTNILFKKIKEQANVIGPKAYTAKKLANIGFILSCSGLVIGIIAFIVIMVMGTVLFGYGIQ